MVAAALVLCLVFPLLLSGCKSGVTSLAAASDTADPEFEDGQEIKAAIVYSPSSSSKESSTLSVYKQILEEEGFPHEIVTADALLALQPDALKKQYAALILPEDVNRKLPQAVCQLLEQYASVHGGKVLIVFDAGIQDQEGKTLSRWPFSKLTGIASLYEQSEVIPDTTPNTKQYLGPWVIPEDSPLRRYFDPGSFQGDTVKIHAFPAFQEMHWRLSGVDARTVAYGSEAMVDGRDSIVTVKSFTRGGAAMYINGRPGHFKFRGNNDLMLRAPLKYFLIDIAKMPRLMASPRGVGGLVFGMHLCSGAYLKNLDYIFEKGLFSEELPMSFAITAGPDCDQPGDAKGFDVLNPGKGLRFIERLKQYGSIGAHGGWIHNYWALHYHDLTSQDRKRYIDLNYQALQQATGMPVLDYAAPGGMHSTELNEYLASWGTKAASIPTSFNSPPTHGWFEGRREDRFWLFGYTGTQYGMAFENMLMSGRAPDEIVNDMEQLVDSVVEKREIRLFYSHPLSIATHPDMWKEVRDYILDNVRRGKLTVKTMVDYADFLDRHSKVEFSITRTSSGYLVKARSSASLKDMTFALPLFHQSHVRDAGGAFFTESDGWSYITIDRDTNEVEIPVTIGG